MNTSVIACLQKGGQKELAESFAKRTGFILSDKQGEELSVVFSAKGVSLCGYGLTYQGDFETMLHRVTNGRLQHEMLVKASKSKISGQKATDATAGMGEDAFLLAASGYSVTMYEQNPIIAILLKDALRRAAKHPELKEIVARMKLVEGDSIKLLSGGFVNTDLVYLDPMFPKRQKTGLIGKKLQLIQKLEPPCTDENELFSAALNTNPERIIVKRPLKSPYLAGKAPNHTFAGKAIRYDCYYINKP